MAGYNFLDNDRGPFKSTAIASSVVVIERLYLRAGKKLDASKSRFEDFSGESPEISEYDLLFSKTEKYPPRKTHSFSSWRGIDYNTSEKTKYDFMEKYLLNGLSKVDAKTKNSTNTIACFVNGVIQHRNYSNKAIHKGKYLTVEFPNTNQKSLTEYIQNLESVHYNEARKIPSYVKELTYNDLYNHEKFIAEQWTQLLTKDDRKKLFLFPEFKDGDGVGDSFTTSHAHSMARMLISMATNLLRFFYLTGISDPTNNVTKNKLEKKGFDGLKNEYYDYNATHKDFKPKSSKQVDAFTEKIINILFEKTASGSSITAFGKTLLAYLTGGDLLDNFMDDSFNPEQHKAEIWKKEHVLSRLHTNRSVFIRHYLIHISAFYESLKHGITIFPSGARFGSKIDWMTV